MSSFLWVEDFDGGNFSQTAWRVFGKALGIRADEFPDEIASLFGFLRERGVTLATSYAEGRRLIDERLEQFDIVVLDIDLMLVGDDESDPSWVKPELMKWHGYLPDANNEVSDERSYSAAHDKMKKVAGYHLWTHLVIDKGFPRHRIQFCSQHGKYLDSINSSFKPAMIEAPEILRKGDQSIGDWVATRLRDPYISLRRHVIGYCGALVDHLEKTRADDWSMLRLSRLPGETTGDFNRDMAIEYVESLPRFLPPIVDEYHMETTILAFMRGMTIEWDRFSATREDRDSFKIRQGGSYEKKVESPIRAAATVLKLLRNTVSHRGSSAIEIDCGEAAAFFVLNMNAIFDLDGMPDVEHHGKRLLGADDFEFSMRLYELEQCLSECQNELDSFAKWSSIGKPGIGMREQLIELQKNGSSEVRDNAIKWLSRLLWHELRQDPAGLNAIDSGVTPVFLVAKRVSAFAFPKARPIF